MPWLGRPFRCEGVLELVGSTKEQVKDFGAVAKVESALGEVDRLEAVFGGVDGHALRWRWGIGRGVDVLTA